MSIRLAIKSVRNENCTKCELHRSTTNVCIMGRGDPRAPIVLLGEAPGRAESATGLPFQGASGQWMQAQLREMECEHLFYITNAVRCRPPQNRKPTTGEIVRCGEYLRGELGAVRPFVVVALGRTAIEALGMGHVTRGKVATSKRWPFKIIFTWHPAYCLRMGPKSQASREFVEAIELARDTDLNRAFGKE